MAERRSGTEQHPVYPGGHASDQSEPSGADLQAAGSGRFRAGDNQATGNDHARARARCNYDAGSDADSSNDDSGNDASSAGREQPS